MDVKTLRALLNAMPDDALLVTTDREGGEGGIRYLGHEPASVEIDDRSATTVARGGTVWIHLDTD